MAADDGIEWGPWIEHDGARPAVWTGKPYLCHTQCLIYDHSAIWRCKNGEIDPSDPRFYWRWRWVRTGWFSWQRRQVCDDPAYAPIIRYRFGRPKGCSAAVDRLAEIVANPDLPVTGPEGPKRATAPAAGNGGGK